MIDDISAPVGEQPTLLAKIPGTGGRCVSFSHLDGSVLFSTAVGGVERLTLAQGAGYTVTSRFNPHANATTIRGMSTRGDLIATAGSDRTVVLSSVESGGCLMRLSLASSPACVEWGADQHQLWIGQGDSVVEYDLRQPREAVRQTAGLPWRFIPVHSLRMTSGLLEAASLGGLARESNLGEEWESIVSGPVYSIADKMVSFREAPRTRHVHLDRQPVVRFHGTGENTLLSRTSCLNDALFAYGDEKRGGCVIREINGGSREIAFVSGVNLLQMQLFRYGTSNPIMLATAGAEFQLFSLRR